MIGNMHSLSINIKWKLGLNAILLSFTERIKEINTFNASLILSMIKLKINLKGTAY